MTPQMCRDLEVARQLARAGVPIFVAPADPSATEGFRLPQRWQAIAAEPERVDAWRPGDALCAIGGTEVDFLDVDPRNGGYDSAVQLQAGDAWPRTFGETATPSGGRHHLITPLGIGKHQGKGPLLGGLDLQGGRADGTGRGFAFLPPTVRKSKVTGELTAYTWISEPDLDALAEWAGIDDSGGQLKALILAARGTADEIERETASPLPALDPLPDDPFSPPGRVFTPEQARAFIGPKLAAFKAMTDADTHFNAALNDLACAYSHFVPAFVTEASATQQMLAAAEHNGSVAYQGKAAVLRTIRSGLKQTGDPWKAVKAGDDADAAGTSPSPVAEEGEAVDQGGGTSGHPGAPERAADPKTRAERVRALLYVRSELDDIPPPTPLISGVLDVATIAFLSGKFGTYKSFVALSWACSVATGRPWFGRDVPTARSVLYVAAEGLSGVRARVRAWESGLNEGERIPDGQFGVIGGALKLTEPEDARTLDAIAQERGAGLIVLDTLHRCTPGLDENSAQDMGRALEIMSLIRERTGATVLACHHTGHSGVRSRGSSSIEDDADASWVIRLAEDDTESRDETNPRTMYHRKTKDGELSGEIPLELVKVGDDAYVRESNGYGTGTGTIWLGARELAIALDKLNVPRITGRKKAGPLLRENGYHFRNAQLEEALRLRKSGLDYAAPPVLVPLPEGA